MKLRPHHLLCTQSYGGKGYSADFVENMDAITSRLRSDPGTIVEIVASTDDVCAKCPLMQGVDACETNDKVKAMDGKVMGYFGIEEKEYVYRDAVREIGDRMDESVLEDICGDCVWYPMGMCRDVLLGLTSRTLYS